MLSDNNLKDLYSAYHIIRDIANQIAHNPWYKNELDTIKDSIFHIIEEGVQDRKDGNATDMPM